MIIRRMPGDAAEGDLRHPVLVADGSVRLEPGEVVRWRGMVEVSQLRRQPGASDFVRSWALVEPGDVVITDRRITYSAPRLQSGDGHLAAVVAGVRAGQVAAPSAGAPLFVGHIRFQWPTSVAIAIRRPFRRPYGIVVLTYTGEEGMICASFTFTPRAYNREADRFATAIGQNLAADIARFRLATRAAHLDPAETATLRAAGNPDTASKDDAAEWHLPGGLPFGQPADAAPPPRVSASAPPNPPHVELPDGYAPALHALLNAGSPDEMRRAISRHPVLLTDEMATFLESQRELIRAEGGAGMGAMYDAWLDLLRTWRTAGPDEGLYQFAVAVAAANSEENPGLSAVTGFVELIGLGTRVEVHEFLDAHPELLTDEALSAIEEFVAHDDDDAEARAMQREYLDLLLRCREVGIAAAVQILRYVQDLPADVVALLRRAEEATRRASEEDDGAALSEAVRLWSGLFGHPDLPESLRLDVTNSLAGAYLRRYQEFGGATDLDAVVTLARTLVADPALETADKVRFLSNYGSSLMARYEARGLIADLEDAIQAFRRAAESMSTVSPEDQREVLANVGSALARRYERTHEDADLAAALDPLEQAFAATDVADHRWIEYAGTIGELSRLAGRIDRAVELQRQVVARAAASSQHRTWALRNLGAALSTRHEATGAASDLDKAIDAYQKALDRTPAESRRRPSLLNDLALTRSRRDGPGDVDAAVAAWQEACCTDALATAEVRLISARNWCQATARRQMWSAAAEAGLAAVAAIDELRGQQVGRAEKELWMSEATEIYALTAYALARLGDGRRAAVTLERGRAIQLAEALQTGPTRLRRLREAGHGEVVDRFLALSSHADDVAPSAITAPSSDVGGTLAERAQARERVGLDLADAVAAIQALDGEFLASPTFEDVAAAANRAPVAYLVATEVGGLGLVVTRRPTGNHAVEPVWLDGLTDQTLLNIVEDYMRAYDARGEDVRAWRAALDRTGRLLWDLVMGPLLTTPAVGKRLTIVAGGLLGMLPLHSAWTEDLSSAGGRRYALDAALLTYAPNARSVQANGSTDGDGAGSVVCVAGAGDLAQAVAEAETVAHSFPAGRVLRGNDASRDAVLAAMRVQPVIHFSCHGRATMDQPLASALILGDGTELTVEDVLRQPTIPTRLAVLSACETAVVGIALPDEAIGLPAAFIQAGAAGVIGSLWPVSDDSTRLLMQRFYQHWRLEGMEPAEALRQAQRWLSTGSGKRSYAHPHHWAAFTFTGQ